MNVTVVPVLRLKLFIYYHLFYNFSGAVFAPRFAIKIDSVFSAIREINEILALTNEPDKLVNTALDAVSQTLNIECCWIQTISDRRNQRLSLAADRGFNDAMRAEITSMDLKHKFSGEIIGMGNQIIIPDLNNDGAYGLASFRTAGFKWLVAVPLMTYRVYGLLGAACRSKKSYDKDTGGLIMVVAGLIANALSKAEFSHYSHHSANTGKIPIKDTNTPLPGQVINEPVKTALPTVVLIPGPVQFTASPEIEKEMAVNARDQDVPAAGRPAQNIPPPAPEKPLEPAAVKKPRKNADPVFHAHTRKMESFRKTHGKP
jgi:hypothetical protein